MTNVNIETNLVFKATNSPANALRIAEQLETEGYTILENRKASAGEITERTGQDRKRAGYMVVATLTPEMTTQYPDKENNNNEQKALEEAAATMPSDSELNEDFEMPEDFEETLARVEEEISTETADGTTEAPKAKKAKKGKLLTDEEAQALFIVKYPHVVPDTFQNGGIGKDTITCVCRCLCGEEMRRNVQDVFQSTMCPDCRRVERNRKRREKRAANRAAKKAAQETSAANVVAESDDN